MRILLTGGSGFLGRSFLEGLTGHEIVAPSHRHLDVTDSAAVDEALRGGRFDAVLHAAVPYGGGQAEGILRAHWNLVRNAGSVGRIYWFGSGAEYGKHRDLSKVREEDAGREVPRDSYGFAKLACNAIRPASGRMSNLRLFGVYGPQESPLSKFISNTIGKALLGLPVAIRQDVVFDYLWIGDLVTIVGELLARDGGPDAMNVTPTRSISLSEIVPLVEAASGRPIGFELGTTGLNFEYTGDNGRLLSTIPGLAFTPYAEGIRRLFAHHEANLQVLDRAALDRDEYRERCRTRPGGA